MAIKITQLTPEEQAAQAVVAAPTGAVVTKSPSAAERFAQGVQASLPTAEERKAAATRKAEAQPEEPTIATIDPWQFYRRRTAMLARGG
jgi:hypothetical protein